MLGELLTVLKTRFFNGEMDVSSIIDGVSENGHGIID
jgi:hypothetical protein